MPPPFTPRCILSRADTVDDFDHHSTLSRYDVNSTDLKAGERFASHNYSKFDSVSLLDVTAKYWSQRFRLFKKWNMGVRLDEVAWFSVTPEAIAVHHAARCSLCTPSTGVEQGPIFVLDAFCGAGGNAIQFALSSMNVLTFDNRLQAIELVLRYNCLSILPLSRM
jgi:hypothetical protein